MEGSLSILHNSGGQDSSILYQIDGGIVFLYFEDAANAFKVVISYLSVDKYPEIISSNKHLVF